MTRFAHDLRENVRFYVRFLPLSLLGRGAPRPFLALASVVTGRATSLPGAGLSPPASATATT